MQQRGTVQALVRAHLKVEGYFFRHAVGMTLGALPFALLSVGPLGVGTAIAWSIVYLMLTLPGWMVFLMALGDVARIASGRTPSSFFSTAEPASWTDVEHALRRLSPVGRLWMRLTLRFGFYMHPLTLPTMFLSGYIRERASKSDDGETHGRASEVAYVAKVHRRERQLEEIEGRAMAGTA